MTMLHHRDRGFGLARPALLVAGFVLACGGPSSRQAVAPASSVPEITQIVADFEALRATADAVPDISFQRVEERAVAAGRLLDRVGAVNTASLASDDVVTLELVRWGARDMVRAVDVYWYSFPIMPASSPFRGVPERLAATTFEKRADLAAYLERLEQYAGLFDAVLAKVRDQADRGIVLPAEQFNRVLPHLRSAVRPPTQSAFYVSRDRLEAFGDREIDDFQAQVAQRIERSINPAAEALIRYVDEELRSKAPRAVGVGQYPGGKEAYRIMVRMQTTLDVTPEQVHEIGLAAVADINTQMQAIRDSLGFRGTKAEFHERLRQDSRFYVRTPEEFGQRLLEYDAKIRPHIERFFLQSPDAPYSVRRLNPALEPSMTYGYYNWATDDDPNGYYNYNGSKLEQRSLLSGAGLTYHELVPGHHFQIGLQRENKALPEFRRLGYFAGYGEGWGEYSSSVVAREMGMYDDLYDLYGRLVFDMFFAVRLVVDTGMNYYGWSRPRAREYMAEHTMESEVQIDSETIRYSMRSPAQALAYRMGRETIVRLRRKAERELGDRFDIRRFHDAVLGSGPMPLALLERHIERFIQKEKGAA